LTFNAIKGPSDRIFRIRSRPIKTCRELSCPFWAISHPLAVLIDDRGLLGTTGTVAPWVPNFPIADMKTSSDQHPGWVDAAAATNIDVER
jgi:hypothetical protein